MEERFAQHNSGNGSACTRLYRPLGIENFIEGSESSEEDKQVKKYMGIYGIPNVRGGSYSNVKLEPDQISSLERELRHNNDLCLSCGSSNHFVMDCTHRAPNRELPREEEQRCLG